MLFVAAHIRTYTHIHADSQNYFHRSNEEIKGASETTSCNRMILQKHLWFNEIPTLVSSFVKYRKVYTTENELFQMCRSAIGIKYFAFRQLLMKFDSDARIFL